MQKVCVCVCMRDSEGKVEDEGILYEKENQFFNHVENGSVEVH